jgi:hypothetical protein
VDMDSDTSSLQNLNVNQNNRFIASKLRVLIYDRFVA